MKTVLVELISDYICPWCYLGKVRLEKLRDQLSEEINIDIDIKPYILYPHIPPEGSPKSAFAKKTKPGMGRSLRSEAKIEEIEIKYKNIEIIPSSREAHRLTWLVTDPNKKYQLAKNIFLNYFEKSLNIGEKSVLIEIAKSSGISDTILDKFNIPTKGLSEVEDSIIESKEEFISVVPSLRLNKKFVIPGLQTSDVWENYIRRAARLPA